MEALSRADRIWLKSMAFCRKYCGCHQMQERSFSVRGYQLPLCARCTGLLCGHIIGFLLGCLTEVPLYAACLMLPLIADGTVQYLTAYESTNLRRVITGVLYGTGFMGCCVRAARMVLGGLFC